MAGRTLIAQGIHLGPTGAVTFNESSLGLFAGQLGQVFEKDAKFYRLVKFNDGAAAVAAGAGKPAYWKDRANYEVTSDYSDAVPASAVSNLAGAFLATITDGNYCFVQIGGLQTIVTDNTVAAGEYINAAADSAFRGTAAGALADAPFGYAVTGDGGATNSATCYWYVGMFL